MMLRKRKPKRKGTCNILLGRLVLIISSLDYVFRLAVEMRKLGLPWTKEAVNQPAQLSRQDLKIADGINGLPTPKRGRPDRSSDGLETLDMETPRKRKPGRPRKSLEGESTEFSRSLSKPKDAQMENQNQFAAVNGVEDHVSEFVGKKGRGRPKKEIAQRRPGRPRKTL